MKATDAKKGTPPREELENIIIFQGLKLELEVDEMREPNSILEENRKP